MWRKKIAGVVAGSILLTLAILAGLNTTADTGARQPDHGIRPEVAAEGRVAVKPDQRAVLAAEVAGRVDKIFVDNLMPVRKGQLLATLYNEDLEEQIGQTEAMLHKAKASYNELVNGSRREDVEEAAANVRRLQAEVELAERNEERDRKLFDDGVISRSQYDVTAAELKKARADHAAAEERLTKVRSGERAEAIEAARAEVTAHHHALEALKASYEKTMIRSPLDGIVIRRYRNASEFADVGQAVLEVADLTEIIVEGDVNELDAGRVQEGKTAIVTSDAFPGKSFRGEVYEVSMALKRRDAEPVDPAVIVDQKILPVKVRFHEKVPLKLGMKVDLKIEE